MPLATTPQRIYGPDELQMMGTVFDRAHERLPRELRGNVRARRKLALLIMRHLARGENNPEYLTDAIVLEFLR